MDGARWTEIERLFHGAQALAGDQRDAYLTANCRSDSGLAAEVRSLLDAADAAPAFIEAPVGLPRMLERPMPERVGPYRLISRLGSGGMGEVYLGRRDDEHYDKEVAVKIITAGMASEGLIRRFVQERQILAALDHPAIARLIDGGATADGLPYFVMEFVDGEPVTAYADRHALSVRARLALIRDVCGALAFAHRNLVVHRDVKPGNILVASGGRPKLLDFGIAKLMAADGTAPEATATVGRLMTLEYASPEQVKGTPVTTASDVYSLGVVLYRLLTGQSPYQVDSDALHHLTTAICVDEPARPSMVCKRTPRPGQEPISGDLDAIVLKALRKEPERRYQSMDQFADDLSRYLEGRPVLARPGTWSYRAGKFMARHRVAMAAMLLMVIGAAIGISMIVVERGRAVRRFNDVRELARAVVFDYHDAIEKLPGSTPVRERLVRDALKYLDSLAGDAAGDVSLQRELATAYQKIGDIQGNTYYQNLGDTSQALGSLQKSLALRETLFAADPASTDLGGDLARGHDRVGDLLWETNDLPGARDHFVRGIAVLTAQRAGESRDLQRLLDLAAGHEKLADVLGNSGFANLGDSAGALVNYQQSLAIRERAALLDPDDHNVRAALFGSHQRLGAALRVNGDFAGAIAHVTKAVAIQESLYGDAPTAAQHRVLGIAYSRAADEFDAAGQADAARDYTLRAVAIFQELFTQDGSNARAHRELGVMTRKAGRLSLKAGNAAGALQQYTAAVQLTARLIAADPANAESARDMFVGEKGLGDALAALDRPVEALAHYRTAAARIGVLVKDAPGNAQARGDLALAEAAIGTVLLSINDAGGAAQAYQRALAIRDAMAGVTNPSPAVQSEAALAAVQLGTALARLPGRDADARRDIERGIDIWTSLDRGGKLGAADRQRLAQAERHPLRQPRHLAK